MQLIFANTKMILYKLLIYRSSQFFYIVDYKCFKKIRTLENLSNLSSKQYVVLFLSLISCIKLRAYLLAICLQKSYSWSSTTQKLITFSKILPSNIQGDILPTSHLVSVQLFFSNPKQFLAILMSFANM